MTKFCESCHTANKDSAKYCSGCKGRFSGVRFSASTVGAEFADSRDASSAMYLPPWKPEPSTGMFKLKSLLVLILVLSAGAFAYWYSTRPEGARLPFWNSSSVLGKGAATPSDNEHPVVVFERRQTLRRRAEGAEPPDASTAAPPAPGNDAAPAKAKVCTETHVALGLCAKK